MNIEREKFEAWLFSQPPERFFNYGSITDCAICSFVKETTADTHDVACSPLGIRRSRDCTLPNLGRSPLPRWLEGDTSKSIVQVRPLTIANMQKRYIEMFGDPMAETIDPDSIKAQPTESVNE